jgi:hypothetical protein
VGHGDEICASSAHVIVWEDEMYQEVTDGRKHRVAAFHVFSPKPGFEWMGVEGTRMGNCLLSDRSATERLQVGIHVG